MDPQLSERVYVSRIELDGAREVAKGSVALADPPVQTPAPKVSLLATIAHRYGAIEVRDALERKLPRITPRLDRPQPGQHGDVVRLRVIPLDGPLAIVLGLSVVASLEAHFRLLEVHGRFHDAGYLGLHRRRAAALVREVPCIEPAARRR